MDIADKKAGDNLKHSSLKVFLLLICSLITLIILIQNISAVQIEMNEQFSQGETLIAKISGNFIDAPGTGNILFYREHVRVPMQFNLSKINNDYYLSALLLDKSPGNYSLRIQDVKYKVGIETRDDDVIKNFTISNNTADFYVVPGFVKTSKDFSLELTNLMDNNIEVEIKSENSSDGEGFFESLFGGGSSTQTVELSSGQTKKVNFIFDDSINESKFTSVNLSTENTSYSVLVYMEFNGTHKSDKEETGELTFEPSIFNISLATNSNTTRVVYLYNKENISVKNISLYVSNSLEQYVNLSLTELDELDENSSVRIEMYISSSENEDNLEGQITAKYENMSDEEDLFAYSAVFLSFIKNYVPQYNNTNDNLTVINTKTCAQLNGTICTSEEQCSGESVYAKDNKCCLAACEPIPEQSTTWKTIGWGLVALVVLFVGWFLIKRYKKTKTSVDLLKVARGKI